MGDLQVLHLCCQLVDIYAAGIQKRLVVGTNHEVLLLLQPPGVTAVFPFGAAIGAGAQDDHHPFLLCGLDILAQVVLVRAPVPFARCHLVEIPEHVRGHSVQSHRLHHTQAVAPVLGWHALIVHFARINRCGFAVVEELPVLNGKGVTVFVGCIQRAAEHRENAK